MYDLLGWHILISWNWKKKAFKKIKMLMRGSGAHNLRTFDFLIDPWEIDGETVETVSDSILGGSKITADVSAAMKLKDAYSLEGKLWPT